MTVSCFLAVFQEGPSAHIFTNAQWEFHVGGAMAQLFHVSVGNAIDIGLRRVVKIVWFTPILSLMVSFCTAEINSGKGTPL